ncbi:MAG: hypothetical protein Q9195_008506 [Heterodermia aff. obscurata]
MDTQAIKDIPPSLLQTLPAVQPPPGVQSNFEDPTTLVPAILGVSSSFLALAVICFSIRVCAKLTIYKKCSWDDLTCSLGFLFTLAMYAGIVLGWKHSLHLKGSHQLIFIGCDKGALGRHEWDVPLGKVISNTSVVVDYLTTAMAVPALGLIKSSLFIQYYALFWPLRWVRISVWVGATISTVFYIAISIVGFILTSPWPGESMLDDILSSHYSLFSRFSIPIGTIGMLVDMCLLILPIKAVSTLKMRTGKKGALTVVFGTGTLQVEVFAGVACSSMPAVYKFFSHHNISIHTMKSSLQLQLSHLLRSNATSEKLSDHDQSPIAHAPGGDHVDFGDDYQFDYPEVKSAHAVGVGR